MNTQLPAYLSSRLPHYSRTRVPGPLHSRILNYPTPQVFGYAKVWVPAYPLLAYSVPSV